jgi:EAL and modified HD-GYP domain-containing signal transduction protein
MPDVFISRQPLVNRQSKIIATRLTLHLGDQHSTRDAAQTLDGLAEAWPQGEKLVFISCGKTPCDIELLDWIAPGNATIELDSAPFLDAGAADFVATLKEQQTALCLDFDAHAAQAVSSGVQFRFIAFDAKTFTAAQLRVLATKTQPYGMGVAINVDTAQVFQECLDAGMNAAASWFFKYPTTTRAKALNPGQAQIVRVLNLVRKNADIKEIETALKHDVALSYKLLRYINSAGFGLSCEIQSFRHAVTILGYEKLNKWLSLLLATASKDPMAPALMHTALTRARLMELLGHDLVDRSDYDNLFITGAFSLLDALLGVDMEQALDAMHLPEPICDALLGRGGLYGPFLDLALASEGSDGEVLAEQVGMLGLSADQFNRAQMQALAFADTMEL